MQEIISNPFKYCNSLTDYSRYKTREVFIGDVAMGGKNPIRIQSMTTTDTMDTIGTVEQSIRIFEAGGEYVRITAPSKKEAHNLAEIKKELKRRGYDIPLIADIHFTPNAAEIAARIVEKVRVNPGNYADKKKFNIVEYSDADYQAEIERIYERFAPLVKICKEEGTAMRVGTNHGSLSDRIMSRYGDTPIGMVESALEFVRICEDLSYHNIVLSMKASNPQVMIQAYRLLMNKMEEENMNYPIHLGVTEAGDGLDGRIKSAVGIGAMLEDGIGDTVRVSLTEAPEAECPVAIDLVNRYIEENRHSCPARHSEETNQYIENSENAKSPIEYKSTYKAAYNPFEYRRRKTIAAEKIGGDNVPIMIADFGIEKIESAAKLLSIGYDYSEELDKWNIADQAADFLYLGKQELDFEIPGTLQKIYDYDYWSTINDTKGIYPLMDVDTYIMSEKKSNQINFVSINVSKLDTDAFSNLYTKIINDKTVVLIVESEKNHWMADIRQFFVDLLQNKIQCPVVLKKSYINISTDKATLYSSTDFGALLIDGLGDGIWMGGDADRKDITEIVFGILQSTRTRISKTEYISCPSCGRTLFDLEETTAMIRKRTHHLKGVKIGIMGCIVNGPGEMADADYGYVGSGIDKITLYRGQEVVKRAVPTEHAVDELIELIREDGNWVDM